MVKVLQTFKVTRMNQILDEYGIARVGAKKEAKANLIVTRLTLAVIHDLIAQARRNVLGQT